MNDISVKIVETPNETVTCAESIPEEIPSEKDPLAIDDVEVPANIASDVKAEVRDETGNCVVIDTKDVKNDCETVIPEALQTQIKDELLKEDTTSINSSLDESDILSGVEIDDNEITSLAGSPPNKEVIQDLEESCEEITESVAEVKDDTNNKSEAEEVKKEETPKVDVVATKLDNKKEFVEIIKCLESTGKLEDKIPKETLIVTEKIEELNKDNNTSVTEEKLQHTVVELKTNAETQIVCKKPIEIVYPIEVSASPENHVNIKKVEEPISTKETKNVEETVPIAKETKTGTYEKKSIERIISDLEKQSALQIKPLKRPAEEISIVPQKRLLLDHKQVRQKDKVSPVEEKTTPIFEKKSNVDQKIPEEKKPKEVLDVDMTEMKEDKTEDKVKIKNDTKSLNGDCIKEETSKRRGSEDSETESPLKKLCQEIERSYPGHDGMLTEYIQNATKGNVDEIQRHTEQLLAEIQTLTELAQKKEHEWNNILHLKKVKEEILLRLLRQKQVLAFEKSVEINGTDRSEPYDFQHKGYAIDKSDEISGVAIKPPCNPPMQAPVMPVSSHYSPMSLPPPYDKAAHMHNMQKNMYPGPMMMPTMPGYPRDMNGQMPNFGLPMGRQGPTKDVKSIIADYRQRNPESSPRRGRRMKSILNPNMVNQQRPHLPKGMDGLNTMNSLNNLGMIFNNLDMNQKAMLERLSQMQTTTLPNGLSFKDVLVQFANMQPQNMQPQNVQTQNILIRPEMMPNRPDHHSNHSMRLNEMNARNMGRRAEKPPTPHEEVHMSMKTDSRHASPSPRLPPPPPYPEISLLPVANSNNHEQPSAMAQQNSLLHGILTKPGSSASQSFSPTLAKLLTSPERKQATTLPSFGQAKNCGEITITPVQPTPPPHPVEPVPVEKSEEVVQLDEEETATSDGSGCGSAEGEERRLVIDEGTEEAPLCQGCRRRDAQFVCAGCANQWYCSRDCQVAAWDEHSDMCSG